MTTKSVDLPHLRSVVLAGHAGAGKTTLAEQLLFRTGAITRLGRVDDGTAHLDFEPEEQKRRESLTLAVASFERRRDARHAGRHAGLPDFVAEVIEGFAAADGAVFVDGCVGRRRGGPRDTRSPGPVDEVGRPASSSTSAIARTPIPRRPSMRCAQPSATRSRRSSWRSGRPSRSAATSTSSIARRGDGTASRRSRSRSRPSSRPRSPAAATSCSKPPPRPTTTS